MSQLLTKIKSQNQIFVFASLALVIAAAFMFVPRASQPDLRADVMNCDYAPQVATLNPFWLTEPGETAGTNCHDYRLISVRNVNAGDFNYVGDDSGNVGDEFYVRIYVHNGAVTNPELAAQTTARNVTGNFSLHGGVILASASASNAAGLSGSAAIQIPSGAHLEIQQGSQIITDLNGNGVGGAYVNFSGDSGNFGFGDMPACFEHVRFIRFKVKVVGPTVIAPTPTPTPSVVTPAINSFNVNFQSCVAGQDAVNAFISYSTQGFNEYGTVVKVSDDMGLTQDYSYTPVLSNGQVDWIVPGHLYTFSFYNNNQLVGSQQTSTNMNCAGPTPTPLPTPTPTPSFNLLTCGPTPQSASIGQSVSFTANGGNGIYNWYSSTNTGNGNNFSTFFNQPGSYNVFVYDSVGHQANCVVNINAPVVIPTPTPVVPTPTPSLTCPTGYINLSPSILNQGETATVSAPFGWFGGRFVSSNTNLVNISGNTVIAGYSSIGSSTITGEGFTAPNGATNCPLIYSAVTVQRPASNACVQRTFSQNSGVYANGSKVSTLNPNQDFIIACDYGVVSGYITLDGNGSNSCSFSGFDRTSAMFNCKAPSQAGTYNVACRMSNNASADNSCSSLDQAGSYVVNAPVQSPLTCGPTPQSASIGQSVSFTANGGNGIYNWTSSTKNGTGANFFTFFNQPGSYNVLVLDSVGHQATCVVNVSQSVPTPTPTPTPFPPVCPSGYFVTVSPGIVNAGQNAFATAPSGWFNGSFQSSNSGIASVTNGGTVTGNTAGTASISGIGFSVQTQNGVASGCNLNPAPVTVVQQIPNLVCQTLTPSVNVNQSASFVVSGGTGAYSWNNGGNPTTGSGQNFSTSFSTSGTKFVSVTSGSQTVTCPVVTVNQPQTSQVTCEIISGSSLVDLNQAVTFRANGGNGTYAFNAPTGNPSTQSSSSNNTFSTQYSTAGSKNVTVISDGQIANCPIITVREPQVATLSCAAVNSPVNVGNYASFTATGGNGQYNWSNAGSPSTGFGQNFSTVYSSAGTKIVSVQSGNQTATCSTQVIDIVVPDVVCNPANQTANLNQTVYFSATGGNGNFNWSASGSTNGGTTNSASFNTAYQTSGDKLVTVSSGGKSAICRVNVLPAAPQTLSCSPAFQSANTGTAVYFNAIGGNAPYSWQALDSTNANGSGSTFNTSYISSFAGQTKTVRLSSGDGQVANCQVAINQPAPTPTPTPVSTGNCNNSQASCNNNTNNNNQTSTGNNSANQNNQSNINGNNNTVTQTNNNCVNNSCNNTIYYIQGGNTVSQNDYRQLSVQKMVRNTTSGGYQNFQDSVSASQNDIVEFQIIVRNVGNQPVSNVRLSDILPSGLSYVSGQLNSEQNLGTLLASDSRTVTFQARVNTNYAYNSNSNQSIQNIARVSGDSVSQVQDDAWVFVAAVPTGCTYNCNPTGTVNLSYSKKAVNETKATYAGQQVDATTVNASREDYIVYTLTVTNSGSVPANNFIITDDLSQVLPYADMVDNGGGSLSGNVINFPGITVPVGGSVSKSFKVRVKYALASNLRYTMTNVYGNTVTININNPQVLGTFTAPKTGADTVGITFSMLLTLGFAAYKKKELLSKLILNN